MSPSHCIKKSTALEEKEHRRERWVEAREQAHLRWEAQDQANKRIRPCPLLTLTEKIIRASLPLKCLCALTTRWTLDGQVLLVWVE